MTSGAITACDDGGKGLPTASRLACVPPQVISLLGSTLVKGWGARKHVGATPVPTQRSTTHSVLAGQSQSSAQGQVASPEVSLHACEHSSRTKVPEPFPKHSRTCMPAQLRAPGTHTSPTHTSLTQLSVGSHSRSSLHELSRHTKPPPTAGSHTSVGEHASSAHELSTHSKSSSTVLQRWPRPHVAVQPVTQVGTPLAALHVSPEGQGKPTQSSTHAGCPLTSRQL